ncbi:GNAT family N-acetyltransferase [Furfurilactobacillus curtus]|uniref:GNAT family acetyltransferase n=1 Tax=Furfurilactobacillus curtus TaxID=1746200 RepID=A0ABQ5JPA4_9LACO
MQTMIQSFDDLTTYQLHTIYQARTDVFVVEQQCAYPEVDATDLIAYHVSIKDEQDELCAYCRLYPGLQGETWHIGRVLVRQQNRGHGLASQLLADGIAWLKSQQQVNQIELDAQVYLVPFYQRIGFKLVGQPFDDYGIQHQHMRLQ